MDFSDDMVDEIFKIFQVESEEIISKINNSLLSLEKNPNDKEAILNLFRDAHSLKGASRMIGLNDVQTVAHKMEDVLGLAKENKISLNSKVVDILYKTVDFLYELIQKSLSKKHEVYSEDISKHVAILDKIEEYSGAGLKEPEKKEFNRIAFRDDYEKINHQIIKCLILLMEIESAKAEDSIKNLFDQVCIMESLFAKIGSYELKKLAEDISFKLKFTMNASNSLTLAETKELHQMFSDIIAQIHALCDMENFAVVDYYSEVFDYQPNSKKSEAVSLQENSLQNNIEDLLSIPASDPDASKVEGKSLELEEIQRKFANLNENYGSVSELREYIVQYVMNAEDGDAKQILDKIAQILDFVIENEVKLNSEILSMINQSINHCQSIFDKNVEVSDTELVFQQLEVVKQILEIDKQKSEPETLSNPQIEKVKKSFDFQDVFNTGEIKTLRVDSAKLDELINQVNELTIEKIKLKKHLQELAKINVEVEEWQRSLSKSFSHLKYYDKKFLQNPQGETQVSALTKQFLAFFSESGSKVQKISSNILRLQRSIQEDDGKMDVAVDSLSEMVKNIRVLPFATVFHLFGRMVRDIAQEKGKKINFEIVGSDTTSDKKIIEEIKAPLIHIIRNSIDHGIETPEERIKLGKSPEGHILLSASQVNNKVILQIKDDGRGINIAKIKEKALSKGFLTPQELASMSDEQITDLIFAPGFSTGDEVTSISGRGIGLDVVQTKITQLNGKVKVISELNKGCCVKIELPMTMSILRVFLAKVAGQIFAIPMDSVSVVLRKKQEELIYKNNRNFIVFENETINLYNVSDVLNLKSELSTSNKKTILILENDGKKLAFCVDELIGEQEVLQKKLVPPFYKLKNISGLTTLVSGEICLIINVSHLFAWADINKGSVNLIKNRDSDNKFFSILLVDDSSTTITLERNILKKAGYEIDSAQNPVEAFEKLKDKRFDLIITDVEMPYMNGFEFVEKLKTDEMYSDIPVIMVSSLSSDEISQKAHNVGAEKYIVKGEFNQQSFLDSVSEILNK